MLSQITQYLFVFNFGNTIKYICTPTILLVVMVLVILLLVALSMVILVVVVVVLLVVIVLIAAIVIIVVLVVVVGFSVSSSCSGSECSGRGDRCIEGHVNILFRIPAMVSAATLAANSAAVSAAFLTTV